MVSFEVLIIFFKNPVIYVLENCELNMQKLDLCKEHNVLIDSYALRFYLYMIYIIYTLHIIL